MPKRKNRKAQRIIKKNSQPQTILKVFCFTPIAKSLNGSLPRSNSSHMLRLDSIPYTYNGQSNNDKKKSSTILYFLKGIRGILRKTIAFRCLEKGIEVCHSTDKETDKHGNKLLPEGFHLLGSCVGNGECILHQIFGSKNHESLISVYADPIASIVHKTAEIPENIQNVHIATENRVNLTYDGKGVQDFNERYFSGYFNFEVDLTQCSPKQIGLIIEGTMNFDRLGRGYNSGYGHVEVKKLQLMKRTITRNPVMEDDGTFIIQSQVTEKPLGKMFQKCLEVWKNEFDTYR